MVMIIAILYTILSYVIFDQQLKITFRKFSALPPWENPTPLFYSLLPKKFKKCKSPSFCQHWKFFKPPCRKGGHYEHVTLEVTQLDKVELLHCLGDKICPGGGCELATIARTTAVLGTFPELLPFLTFTTISFARHEQLPDSCVRGCVTSC